MSSIRSDHTTDDEDHLHESYDGASSDRRPTYRIPNGFVPLQTVLDSPNPVIARRATVLLPSLLQPSKSSSSLYRLDSNAGIRRASGRVLTKPELRSSRLIGNSNPRYQWERYKKSDDELKKMKKPLRQYYKRTNMLVDQYIWADNMLNSTLVPRLLDSYASQMATGPNDNSKNRRRSSSMSMEMPRNNVIRDEPQQGQYLNPRIPLKRKASFVRKMADEESPLLDRETWGDSGGEDQEAIVKFAIYINLIANAILLAGKVVVTLLTDSLSVIASLVDSALDFLSTAIVWITTHLIGRKDQYTYPIGRRKLEPVGVLVFSVIMITSFIQVALEALQRLIGPDRNIVQLSNASIIIMTATVVIKGACYIWCRLIKSSSVQALAQDALTDCYFNTFSILFPLVGYFAKLWWLDPLGGLLLSIFVIIQWARTSSEHIRNLTGAAATPDERNLILYVCMRFASSIEKVTSVQAYHAGDLLNVEVEILLDEHIPLKDSHDLGEALQYVIESMPIVDRAFVHIDYSSENPYGHLER